MKYLIIADIHSNLEALQAVLEDAQNHGGFGDVWCMGDVVGYGPDPSACIKLLKQLDPLCVSGNHDLATVGKLDIEDFNSAAARANRWTSGQLGDDDRAFLLSLPEKIIVGDFTLVHGSPRQPAWEYIAYSFTASDNFSHFKTKYCLVGHTHIPYVFEEEEDMANECYMHNEDVLMLGDKKLIINPGGVGQPRDRDPRASYAIYDSEDNRIFHYRVSYDIALTQDKMERAGLPHFLITRLASGI
ncbi:MAG: metallophosphoesterase family protein [Dehalococcoidia bacterium]|nr:metallophosphoesterase family protein [Dehalococcoidia bacterium]